MTCPHCQALTPPSPRRWRRPVGALLALGGLTLLVACDDAKTLSFDDVQAAATAPSAIDVEETVDSLVAAGIPRDQASCIVAGVEDQYGDRPDVIDALTDSSPELAPADQKAIAGIIGECVG